MEYNELSMETTAIIDRLVAFGGKDTKKADETKETFVSTGTDTENMIEKLVRLAGHGALLENKDKQEDKLADELDAVLVLRQTIAEYQEAA